MYTDGTEGLGYGRMRFPGIRPWVYSVQTCNQKQFTVETAVGPNSSMVQIHKAVLQSMNLSPLVLAEKCS